MRVVVDTNTWISRLLIANSIPAKAIDRALAEADIVVSDSTMEELAEVLSRDKWDKYLSIQDRQEFITRVLQITTPVAVISEVSDCRDPKDNTFLALALDAEAQYIVTGDKDLLALHPWRGVNVLSPAKFLESLQTQTDS